MTLHDALFGAEVWGVVALIFGVWWSALGYRAKSRRRKQR